MILYNFFRPGGINYMYTDSHCHITEDRLYERIDEVLKNMHEVSNCMIMCTNETEFKRALALKENTPSF